MEITMSLHSNLAFRYLQCAQAQNFWISMKKKASLGVRSLCLRETPAANQFKIPKCNPFISTFVSRFAECSLLRVLKCGTFLPNLLHSCTTDTKHFNNSTIQPSNKL